MYLQTDLKKIITNKLIVILIGFLFVIMIADPLSIYYKVVHFGFENNMYHHWLLFNASANFGGDIFHTLYYVFPIIFTGMIYFQEDSSSVKKWMICRGKKRIMYFLSKMFTPVIFVFVTTLVLLLFNLFFAVLLFENNTATIAPIFIPAETSFAHKLFSIHPLYVCLFYSLINAVVLALFTGFCIGLHMAVRFPNIYIAMIIPVIIIFITNYLFDAIEVLRIYSINFHRQPAASYAMSVEFSVINLFLALVTLLVIDIILMVVGIIRNRNVM